MYVKFQNQEDKQMKRSKKKATKKTRQIFNKLPIAILAGGLIGIGMFPFHAIKKKLGKKSKKRKLAA